MTTPAEPDPDSPLAPPPQNQQTKTTNSTHWPPWVLEHSAWSRWLEKIALWLERPINKLSGTTQLNPFYHTGTIAFFLLMVVGATGFYLFIFFRNGFDLSYESVVRYDEQLIARFIRAMHRYASGALVITTLLHAYRILFMERFRGPRWLAWLTGVLMTVALWLAGVTGYWLVWDERAQMITYGVRDMPWGGNIMVVLEQAWRTGESWFILFGILVVHVLLFVATAVFFFLHIIRLNHAKWVPGVTWIVGMGIVLVLGSLLFPLPLLPPADFTQQPTAVSFDPIFLFYLPTIGNPSAALLLWGTAAFLLAFFALLPWLPRLGKHKNNPPKVRVIEEKCTGCTRCANDCPYKALEMIELPEGSAHKFLAVANPDMCVACGICLGSCLDNAITLGDTPPEMMWTEVRERIAEVQSRAANPTDVELIFTCERYANQSARPFINSNRDLAQAGQDGFVATHENVAVIAVPCAGSIPPDLLTFALAEGAAEVRVIGCPPDDCAHRLGNLWAEQRLTRERPPRLRRKYANVPITAVWLPPDEFKQGLAADINAEETNWLETRRIFETMTWKNFVPAFTLLALVLLVQILFTELPFPLAMAADPTEAHLQIVLADMGLPLVGAQETVGEEGLSLRVLVDGQLLGEYEVDPTAVAGRPFVANYSFPSSADSGEHRVEVYYQEHGRGTTYYITDRAITLAPGDIHILTYDITDGHCWAGNCTQ
jgi:NAD-dependent dihydropyrimidine dehydrogenase PreA subunit